MIKTTIKLSSQLLILFLLTACAAPEHLLKSDQPGGLTGPQFTVLNVTLQGGKVKLTPGQVVQDYKPISFNISNNSCQKITLSQAGQNPPGHMQVCYQQNALFLDPEKYSISKTKSAIRFNYMPLWNQGFTYYGVNSSGPAHLTAVNVGVKILKPNDQSTALSS